jgi:type-2 restriction enzyme nspV
MKNLTLDILKTEVAKFSLLENTYENKTLYAITDGKAIGTYIEHKFKDYLSQKYCFEKGSSANGIDFPELELDIKVTSIIQPQSSCPFRSARQKIYGLGYNLLIFVYDKEDKHISRTSKLNILHAIFLEKDKTADYQLTTSIHKILENNGNKDDLVALFSERNLPVDEISSNELANEVLENKPQIGYLTISNALQWRLQYSRTIENAGTIKGIDKLL